MLYESTAKCVVIVCIYVCVCVNVLSYDLYVFNHSICIACACMYLLPTHLIDLFRCTFGALWRREHVHIDILDTGFSCICNSVDSISIRMTYTKQLTCTHTLMVTYMCFDMHEQSQNHTQQI